MSDKIIKTVQLKWTWNGDIYLLKGFNVVILPVNKNPKDNPDSVIVSAFVPVTEASTNVFKHSFTNITLDRFATYTPWVQTVFENDDSQWVSFNNQIADDDGSATLVTTTNPTLQQVVDMANDNKVTPQEKANLKLEWDEISDEHIKILSDCTNTNIPLKDINIYKTQAQALADYLNAGESFTYIKPGAPGYTYPELIKSAGTTTLSTDGYTSATVFRNKFLDYYAAKKLILDKIRDKIIQDSQGDIGDIPGLEDILPNNPVAGGYFTGGFAINRNHLGVTDAGEVQVISGKFIHPNGKKYIIPGGTYIPTALEGKEDRHKYILFIGSDKGRFKGLENIASTDFIPATYKNKQWSYYLNDDIPKHFEVNENDCIVAKIKEFSQSDEGTGIKSIITYYDTRDSVFDTLTNGGEVQGLYMKDGLVMLNAEFVKTGKLASVNGVSEFDLDRGTFRLGGTGTSDYKMYFDGKDLYMGEGAIKWANLDEQSKTNLKGEPGRDGQNGQDGRPGRDGQDAPTQYTWIRYADNASGGGISASPNGKLYIGISYNRPTPTPSNTPSDYAWSLIKGTDGRPGTNGADGKTYYTWIKYADNASGAGMSDSPTNKAYMGIAHNKPTSTESTNPSDYAWSLIKGADGGKGDKGDKGNTGATGATGATGNSAAIIYRREVIKPSTPSGNSPSGWSTSSDNAPGTGVLWMSQGIKNPSGSLVGSWTEPVQLEASTTNLFHNHKWTLGTGTCGIFRHNGKESENFREIAETPFGRGIVWRAISKDADATGEDGPDGGWNADIPIDHTKGYMLSVWAKQTHTTGTIYFGCRSYDTVNISDGSENTNPYFWYGDLPVMNKWYLLVAFINSSQDSSTAHNPRGGIYDPATGEKVIALNTFKNKSGIRHQTHRTYYYYEADASWNRYATFFAPRFDVIDGTEPTISDLLGMSPQLDWVKDWNGTKTEIGGTQVVAPKIFAGTKESNGSATGVAMGVNVFGSGSNYSGIAGYKAGLKTFHLKTDGSAVFGTRAGNQLIVNSDGSVDTPNINASKVTAGTLRATNGKSSINLDNGNMNLGSKSDSSYLVFENGVLDIRLGGKTVATSGDITSINQTINSNTEKTSYTFKSIGFANMLPNSDFEDSINRKPFGFDYVYLRWDNQAGGDESLDVWSSSSEWVPRGKRALVLEGGGYKLTNGVCTLPIRAGFDCPKFMVTPGETYRVSFKYAGHRIKRIVAECLCYDKNGNRLMDTNHATFLNCTKSGGKEISDWDVAKISFTAQDNAAFCCIRIYKEEANININNGSNTTYLFMIDPMVNQGPLHLDYTARTAEAFIGSTEITKDGLKVSMANGAGPQGYSVLSAQGLEMFDSNNHRYAWFGDSKTAFIDRLETQHITAPNVVNKYVGAINLYVGPTQQGDGSGRDWANRIGGIGTAITNIRRDYGEYIHGYININVADGEYYESIWIEGLNGAGDLTFYLSMETYIVGQWKIINMGKIVKIKGGRSGEDTNNGARLVCDVLSNDAAHIAVQHSHLELDNIRAYNRNAGDSRYRGSFVHVSDGGSALIWASDFSRYMYGLLVVNCSIGNMALCRGYCYYPLVARYGAHATTAGYPKGKENSWSDYGGEIHSWGEAKGSIYDPDYEAAPAPPPVPTPTYKWIEQSFSLTNLRTVPEGSGSGTTGRNGEWGQGKWGSYKAHRGYASIGSSPSSWCSGGRNFTVWLTMTRLNTSHGYGGAVPVPKIKEPSGNFWNSGVAFARGDTKTIQLPASIANAIVNGSMQTLEMWAGANNNDYSFYNNASIRIKCEKPV